MCIIFYLSAPLDRMVQRHLFFLLSEVKLLHGVESCTWFKQEIKWGWGNLVCTSDLVQHEGKGVKVVQTGHPTGLLVEKGNIGVTLYTVVWPGVDLLSTHRSRWLEWTKMGPTQICFLDVCFSGQQTMNHHFMPLFRYMVLDCWCTHCPMPLHQIFSCS